MAQFIIFPGNVPKGVYPNVKGVSVQKPYPSLKGSEPPTDRRILRRAWNGKLSNSKNYGIPLKIGGFRAVNNAGDALNRQYYSCGGSNMISSRPGSVGLHLTTKDGGQATSCDNTGIAPTTCNPKYVYDSSDYIRYKKLKSTNISYNAPDYCYGGANANNTQSVLRRIRSN